MPRKTQSRTVQRPSADTTVGERRIRIRAIVEASSYLMRRGVITKGSMVKLSTARLLGAAAAAAVAVLRAKKIMQDFSGAGHTHRLTSRLLEELALEFREQPTPLRR